MNLRKITVERIEPAALPRVDGWSLVLCLLLTFVCPGQAAYHILWRTLPNLFHAHDATRILLLSAYSITFASVALFSFFCGAQIMARQVRCRQVYEAVLGDVLNCQYCVFSVLVGDCAP